MSGIGVVSCDINGEWTPDNEEDACIVEFSRMLREPSSYEELMMENDLEGSSFNAAFLGLSSHDEVVQWLKDYYSGFWRADNSIEGIQWHM